MNDIAFLLTDKIAAEMQLSKNNNPAYFSANTDYLFCFALFLFDRINSKNSDYKCRSQKRQFWQGHIFLLELGIASIKAKK